MTSIHREHQHASIAKCLEELTRRMIHASDYQFRDYEMFGWTLRHDAEIPIPKQRIMFTLDTHDSMEDHLDRFLCRVDIDAMMTPWITGEMFAFNRSEARLGLLFASDPPTLHESLLTAIVAACIHALERIEKSYVYARTLYMLAHRWLPIVMAPSLGDNMESLWNRCNLSLLYPLHVPSEWLNAILRGVVQHSTRIFNAFDQQYHLSSMHRHPHVEAIQVGQELFPIKAPSGWNLDATTSLLIAACLSRYVHMDKIPVPIVEWLNHVSPGCVDSPSFTWMRIHARRRHAAEIVPAQTPNAIFPHMASRSGWTNGTLTLMVWIRGLWTHWIFASTYPQEASRPFVMTTESWSGDTTRYQAPLATCLVAETSMVKGNASNSEDEWNATLSARENTKGPLVVNLSRVYMSLQEALPTLLSSIPDAFKVGMERIVQRESVVGPPPHRITCKYASCVVAMRDPVAAEWLYRFQLLARPQGMAMASRTLKSDNVTAWMERFVFQDEAIFPRASLPLFLSEL